MRRTSTNHPHPTAILLSDHEGQTGGANSMVPNEGFDGRGRGDRHVFDPVSAGSILVQHVELVDAGGDSEQWVERGGKVHILLVGQECISVVSAMIVGVQGAATTRSTPHAQEAAADPDLTW